MLSASKFTFAGPTLPDFVIHCTAHVLKRKQPGQISAATGLLFNYSPMGHGPPHLEGEERLPK